MASSTKQINAEWMLKILHIPPKDFMEQLDRQACKTIHDQINMGVYDNHCITGYNAVHDHIDRLRRLADTLNAQQVDSSKTVVLSQQKLFGCIETTTEGQGLLRVRY